jgi:hypothetical protein
MSTDNVTADATYLEAIRVALSARYQGLRFNRISISTWSDEWINEHPDAEPLDIRFDASGTAVDLEVRK